MYRYLLFLLITVHSVTAQEPCQIQNLRIEQTPCRNDGDFFVFFIFDRQNTSDSFTVSGNGKSYGTFLYADVPVRIGPLEANCTTEYAFVVKDKAQPDCMAFVDMGKKCCSPDCRIYIDSVFSTCRDNTLDMEVSVSRPSANLGNYQLTINGQNRGAFSLGSVAVVTGVGSELTEPVIEIIACMADQPGCCDTFYYVNPCVCSVTEFKTQVFDCNREDSTFSVKIDFMGTAVSDSFLIGGNNTTYGIYAYNQLPVTISDLPFSDTKFYEFLVIDRNSPFCFGAYEMGIVDSCRFNCTIRDPEIEVLPCNEDGQFFVRMQFEEENTSHSGFGIRGNGQLYGTFDYGKHYHDIGPMEADCSTIYEFLVQDTETESCQNVAFLTEPVCCKKECQIREFSVTENCAGDSLLSYTINFEHNQDSLQSFRLWTNGVMVGDYTFGQLPVNIQNITFRNRRIVFKIIPLHNDECLKEFIHEFECLPGENEPCLLAVQAFERGECTENGEFFIFFKLITQNTGNQGFKVYDAQNMSLNTFDYGQETYKIGPFKGDCETKYRFLINDVAFPDCAAEFGQEEAVCCSDACSLDSIRIEETECVNGFVTVTLNFNYAQTSGSFTLKLNGSVRGFYQYQDLPIVIRQLEPKTTYKVIIQDNEKECAVDFTFETPECSVSVGESVFRNMCIYRVQEGFIIDSVSELNQPFTVHLSDMLGRLLTIYPYSTGSFVLPMTHAPTGMYFITIRQRDHVKTVKMMWYP